jgi:Heme exporter protein D (CcmD)
MNLEGPIQTFNYMVLGYAVILGCIAALLISMVVRYRKLRRELEMLQDLEKQGRS